MLLIDIFWYYVGVGFFMNLILALIAIYGDEDGGLEVDGTLFFLTMFAWPYTLFNVISALLSKEE